MSHGIPLPCEDPPAGGRVVGLPLGKNRPETISLERILKGLIELLDLWVEK